VDLTSYNCILTSAS